ncbi:MAG TPA: quinone oxidoreductase [Ktedonobacterales bacterium]|nr:quinone oxidoreductase [Ktedonobacterales bacterium]
MQVVRFYEYGGPEVLKVEDAPVPEPGPGEALVRVAAAGVNYADTRRRLGAYFEPTPLPWVVGSEVAGMVAKLGPNVTGVQEGQRVMALTAGGGYAEYAVVAAQALLPIPPKLSFTQAAALPLQGLTAYYLLKLSGRLKAGESVLVHAAAGGVGTLAVQMAKLLGAGKVIATASTPAKLEFACSLGADAQIDYTREDVVAGVRRATNGKGADIILDGVGGDVFELSLRSLAADGRLVVYGLASGKVVELNPVRLMRRNQSVVGFYLGQLMTQPEQLRPAMEEIAGWLAAEKLRLMIGHVFPLAEAARAHRQLGARETTGKIVLLTDQT